jgi:hypothetical protein
MNVMRMHGLRARVDAGLDDALGHKVALSGWRRADMHRLVGQLHVQCITIRIRIDGHGLDAHFLCRLDHPAGDLSAVGYQYLVKHG